MKLAELSYTHMTQASIYQNVIGFRHGTHHFENKKLTRWRLFSNRFLLLFHLMSFYGRINKIVFNLMCVLCKTALEKVQKALNVLTNANIYYLPDINQKIFAEKLYMFQLT